MVLSDFDNQIVAMEAAIRECEQRFGSRSPRVNHPVLGFLTGEEWRKFHWVNGVQHLKQIKRLRLMAGRHTMH
jgi:hypothetical protein